MFSGKRDKGNFWCEWAQCDDHHHSIIHFRSHHEEVGVCFLYSSVICVSKNMCTRCKKTTVTMRRQCTSECCDPHSWLFDCLLVCYLIVAVIALNVVSVSIEMLMRYWLLLSEQSVTSTQAVIHYDRTLPVHKVISFQCFDIVGWASGAAFGL